MTLIKINENDTRIKKLADYLLDIINKLINTKAKQINANWLSKNINNYSLNKIPTASKVEEDIVGNIVKRDVYLFRSRNEYTEDFANNLRNIGFFEEFESIIENNNEEGILPEIDKIISIECLNCGTVKQVQNNTCEMDIQIQIEYEI